MMAAPPAAEPSHGRPFLRPPSPETPAPATPDRLAVSLRRELAGWESMTPGRRRRLIRDYGAGLAIAAGLEPERLRAARISCGRERMALILGAPAAPGR